MSLNLSQIAPADLEQLAGLLARLQNTDVSSTAAAPAAPGAPGAPGSGRKKKARKADTIAYLTEPQLEALMAVKSMSVRDRAIFRVAYHRGLRATEIGMIQIEDLDMRAERIRFKRLKASNGGEYHLCSSEVRALRAWLKERGAEPGPLFPSNRGTGISQQMLDVLIKRYGRLAGLPPELCHMHVLKHSCGTHLLNRGESIEDVQDHLGHVSISSTLIYAKFTSKRRHQRDKRLRDW
jgi:site-specific recombinase XerD